MKLITKFKWICLIDKDSNGWKSHSIQNQIECYKHRLIINFKDTKGNNVCISRCRDSIDNQESYTVSLSEKKFEQGELKFLAKTYLFELTRTPDYRDDEYIGLFREDFKYGHFLNPAQIEFIEKEGKEYLVIYFETWKHGNPRGAAEDQLGEDVTYIYGIWEAPLLTDEIINKIKQI